MDSQNTFSYSIPNCSSVFNSVEDLPAGAVLKDSNNLAPNSTTSIAASVASNLSSNSSNFMQQQPLTSRLSMYNLSGISTAPTSGETSIPSAHGALNTSPLPSPAHSPRPIRRIHQGTGSYSPTSSPVQQRKATAARSPSPNDSRDSSSALPGRPARSTTFNSRIQTNNILGQEALLFNHSFTATKLTHEPILIDNLKLTNGSTELNETVNGRSASSINPTTTSSSFTSNRSLQQASSLDTLNNILPSRTRARAGTTSSISSVSAVSVSKRPQLTREFFLMKNTMDSSAPSTAIDSASSASRLLYSASIESLLASQQSTVAIGTTMMGSGSSIYQFDFKFQNNVVAPSRYVTPAASVDDLLFPPSSGRASTINAVITSCPVLSQQSTASNDLIYDDSSKSSMQKSILLRFLDTLVEADGKRYVMSKVGLALEHLFILIS